MPQNFLLTIFVPGIFAILYLTALILGLVYYRRCPAACSLVVASSILNLTITIARVGYQRIWLPMDGNFEMFGIVMTGLGLGNWVAYGLMIVAVFVGRNPPAPAPYRSARRNEFDDDDWDKPAAAPPPKTTESTGFQEHR